MTAHSKLPILFSVPHGGIRIPGKLQSLCSLDTAAILRDGDTWARELYALKEQAAYYIDTDIARAVIDLNRAPDDLPPENPDGLVKTVTTEGKQVWKDKNGLPFELVEELKKRYYYPYHLEIKKISKNKNLLIGIDCHTMLAVEPGSDPDRQIFRPLICISNGGNSFGKSAGEPLTAPESLISALADAFIIEFQHEDVEVNTYSRLVGVNQPFRGGYIIKHHGGCNNMPWIQLEFSRALYLPSGQFSSVPDAKSLKRLNYLKTKLITVLKRVT